MSERVVPLLAESICLVCRSYLECYTILVQKCQRLVQIGQNCGTTIVQVITRLLRRHIGGRTDHEEVTIVDEVVYLLKTLDFSSLEMGENLTIALFDVYGLAFLQKVPLEIDMVHMI